MREIAIHIHDSRSVAKEAVFRSHQALVRRCSPQVAQRSHTRVFHRLVVNLVEPRFSGIDKLGDWRRSLRVWDTLCLHDVLNSVLVLNECDDAHLCFTLAFDPSSARLRPRRELCRTLAEVRPRVGTLGSRPRMRALCTRPNYSGGNHADSRSPVPQLAEGRF